MELQSEAAAKLPTNPAKLQNQEAGLRWPTQEAVWFVDIQLIRPPSKIGRVRSSSGMAAWDGGLGTRDGGQGMGRQRPRYERETLSASRLRVRLRCVLTFHAHGKAPRDRWKPPTQLEATAGATVTQ